jgi:alanyl-tRNA synthetase
MLLSYVNNLKLYSCEGTYSFIGHGVGKGKKITYAEAWKGKLRFHFYIHMSEYTNFIGFEKSFTTSKIPCTSIERYPVVARWRNDVDFVAAGIFCF